MSNKQEFVALVAQLEWSERDGVLLMITDSVALDGQAVFVGPSAAARRVIGVALDVERYLSLFSGYVGVAAEAFGVELFEPGWVKGDRPSPAARSWAADRHAEVWWPALHPPNGERGR